MTRNLSLAIVALLVFWGAAACSSTKTDEKSCVIGTKDCICNTGKTCQSGLKCEDNICVLPADGDNDMSEENDNDPALDGDSTADGDTETALEGDSDSENDSEATLDGDGESEIEAEAEAEAEKETEAEAESEAEADVLAQCQAAITDFCACQSCAELIVACLNSPDCVDLGNCANACQVQACLDQCIASHSQDSFQKLQNYTTCYDSHCSNPPGTRK